MARPWVVYLSTSQAEKTELCTWVNRAGSRPLPSLASSVRGNRRPLLRDGGRAPPPPQQHVGGVARRHVGDVGACGRGRATRLLSTCPAMARLGSRPLPPIPGKTRFSQARGSPPRYSAPFMICSTVTASLKGRPGSSLGVRRKHWGVPGLRM